MLRALPCLVLLFVAACHHEASSDDACGGAPSSGTGGCFASQSDRAMLDATTTTVRAYRSTLCLSGVENGVYPSSTEVELCLGVGALEGERSFTVTRADHDVPLGDGTASIRSTRSSGTCHSAQQQPVEVQPKPVCDVTTKTSVAESGTVRCQRAADGHLACSFADVVFVDPDANLRTTGAGWLRGDFLVPTPACAVDPPACPDEPSADGATTCLQATGDVLDPVLVTKDTQLRPGNGEVCLSSQPAAESCAERDDVNRQLTRGLSLCLGVGNAATLDQERTFTVNGKVPFIDGPPAAGEAAFQRHDTAVTLEPATSDTIDDRAWLAQTGTITCGPRADGGVRCTFAGVTFTSTSADGQPRSSTASGWIHAAKGE